MTSAGERGREALAFDLGGGEVHVHGPDSGVAPGADQEIAALFPDYRKREPSEARCRCRIQVESVEGSSGERYRIHAPSHLSGSRKENASRALEFARGEVARDRVEMLTILEGMLARGLLETASDRVHLHAAGVRVGDGALLALGSRGAGKSSLALAWSRLGLPVLGDDVVFVDEAGRAEAFRRLFKVDPERLESHGVDPASTPVWVEGSEEAWFDPRSAGGWVDGAIPVRGVAVLDRIIVEGAGPARSGGMGIGRDDAPRGWTLVPLEPAEALNDLLASVVWTGRSQEASVDPLLALLDGSDTHRLSFASSARAAERLVDVMRGSDRIGP